MYPVDPMDNAALSTVVIEHPKETFTLSGPGLLVADRSSLRALWLLQSSRYECLWKDMFEIRCELLLLTDFLAVPGIGHRNAAFTL